MPLPRAEISPIPHHMNENRGLPVEGPVEGLAATLHARFVSRPHLQTKVKVGFSSNFHFLRTANGLIVLILYTWKLVQQMSNINILSGQGGTH